MSPETIAWVLTAHIFGIITWLGPMLGLALALRQGAAGEPAARTSLGELAKRLGMAMDAGAAITIVAGIALIYGLSSAGVSPLKLPWMHVKLTLVAAGLLSSHVFLRIRAKRLAGGEVSPLPQFLFPALHALLIGILIMAIVRPF